MAATKTALRQYLFYDKIFTVTTNVQGDAVMMLCWVSVNEYGKQELAKRVRGIVREGRRENTGRAVT